MSTLLPHMLARVLQRTTYALLCQAVFGAVPDMPVYCVRCFLSTVCVNRCVCAQPFVLDPTAVLLLLLLLTVAIQDSMLLLSSPP